MIYKPTDATSLDRSPHLNHAQIRQRLEELETATGQRRIDLITELAWRPAWAIRSRRGALSALVQWWKAKQA